MKVLTRSSKVTGNNLIIPLIGGIVVAQCGTAILHQSYLWAGLITVGMAIAVLSLAAKRFKDYWLMIFALVLPLDIKKMLIESSYVRELAQVYGIPIGELPGPVVYLSDLAFAVLMAAWLFDITFKKEKVFFPKSNWYALAFLGWAGLSLINAKVFSYAFFDLLRTLKFYLLYLYIANNVRSMPTLKTLVRYFLVGVVIQGSICLYQYISQDIGYIFGDIFGKQDLYSQESIDKFREFFTITPDTELKRASGTVGPINAQAQYFEFLLPVSFLLCLASAKFWRNMLSRLALVLGLAGLTVTFSRGGLIGIAAGIAVVFVLAKRLQIISKEKYLTILIPVLFIGIMLTPTVYSFFMARHQATLARFHLYKVGLDMVRAHPFLGVGLNNHVVMEPYYDPQTYIFPTPTHNHYLFIASEVGIPGLVFFLAFFSSAFLMALKAARSKVIYQAVVALGIVGAFVAIGTHNLVDHLSYHTNLTLLWLFAGLAAALSNLKSNENDCKEELVV